MLDKLASGVVDVRREADRQLAEVALGRRSAELAAKADARKVADQRLADVEAMLRRRTAELEVETQARIAAEDCLMKVTDADARGRLYPDAQRPTMSRPSQGVAAVAFTAPLPPRRPAPQAATAQCVPQAQTRVVTSRAATPRQPSSQWDVTQSIWMGKLSDEDRSLGQALARMPPKEAFDSNFSGCGQLALRHCALSLGLLLLAPRPGPGLLSSPPLGRERAGPGIFAALLGQRPAVQQRPAVGASAEEHGGSAAGRYARRPSTGSPRLAFAAVAALAHAVARPRGRRGSCYL